MADEQKKNKFVKPSWLPWVLLGAELAIVLVIGFIVIKAAMM